ncbi:zinc-binding dehydrogenase [Streptomyces sp. NPDC050095]|uniref:zinc-binding dehydrogenase n=1 Tax=unclassified Streptomyces TaxID=2593676 RepID=UPI003448F248
MYRQQYHTHEPESVDRCHKELTRWVSEGVVTPLVSDQLPFSRAPEAVQRVADGRAVGRIVVLAT